MALEDTTDVAGTLLLSNSIAIERNGPETAVLVNTTTNRRLEVTPAVLALVRRFDRPRTLSEVCDADQLQRVAPVLRRLTTYGVLVDMSARTPLAPMSRRTTVSPTVFRTPSAGATPSASDVAVIGMPYDAGNVVLAGCRKAPEVIRRRSCDLEYRVDVQTGRPMGWFDVEMSRRELEGVTIQDWGDVRLVYGEDPERFWARAMEVCAQALSLRCFPFILGGDHSITYPFVAEIQRTTPLHLVWLDAHTDYAELSQGVSHNHKNVLRRILQLPNIAHIVHVGHRGYTVSDKVNRRPDRMTMITAAQLRHEGPRSVTARLPQNASCYVSLDIDVLDAAYAPATSTPGVGGLTLQETKDLLRALGAHCYMRAMDLVEVNPLADPGPLTLLHACHLMTTGLVCAMARRTAEVVS